MAFAQISFEDGSTTMTFTSEEVQAADRSIRARMLTHEDIQCFESTGVLKPIALPDDVARTPDVENLSRALRLTGHDQRSKFAAFAQDAGVMPDSILVHVQRNRDGCTMPLPCHVSTAALQLASWLPYHFSGRLTPLWGGSGHLVIFVSDGDGLDSVDDLASWLFYKVGPAFADDPAKTQTLLEWIEELPKWQGHFREMHHAEIDLRRLISEHKAHIVRFDVGSIIASGLSVDVAMSLYHDYSEAIYLKEVKGEYPNARAMVAASTIIVAQFRNFLEGVPDNIRTQHWAHATAILDASVMFRVESKLYEQHRQTNRQQ